MKLASRRDLYVLAVVAVMEGVGRLPSVGLAGGLVRGIGELAHRLSRGKRERILRALSVVFGDTLSHDERGEIARRSFHEFWREGFSITGWGRRRIRDGQVDVRGLESLERASRAGRGAILWESAYLGQRHLSKWILAERGWKVDQVHLDVHAAGFGGLRADRSWVSERFIKPRIDRFEAESISNLITLKRSDSLAFTRVLRQRLLANQVLAVTADVPFGRGFVDQAFLGGVARFPTGMVSLSRATGAPILPMFCIEEPEGRITLTVGPPIDAPADADRDTLLATVIADYAARLERLVREYPGCYRRWERLGAGGWEVAERT